MAKNDVRDIARAISEKHKLTLKDSEEFLTALFNTLHEGLGGDKQVKVKGFGTFKVIDVKERESIDVNTGERIKIEGRSKITFLPDSVMKDLVNKPFSQFETVVLNEGIDFSDFDAADTANEEEPMAETAEDENVCAEEETETVNNNDNKDMKEDNVENVEEKTVEEIEKEEARQRYYARKKKRITIMSAVFLITVIVSFCLGYFLGRKSYVIFPLTIAEEVVEETPADDFIQKAPAVDAVKEEQAKKDSIAAAKAKSDSVAKAKEAEQQTQKAEEKAVEENTEKADAADVLANARRVMASGAYEIVGTETTVTVKKGQTLGSISKFYFGDGMECYLQVHNGVAEVNEGDKIKIPKLKAKKQRK